MSLESRCRLPGPSRNFLSFSETSFTLRKATDILLSLSHCHPFRATKQIVCVCFGHGNIWEKKCRAFFVYSSCCCCIGREELILFFGLVLFGVVLSELDGACRASSGALWVERSQCLSVQSNQSIRDVGDAVVRRASRFKERRMKRVEEKVFLTAMVTMVTTIIMCIALIFSPFSLTSW